VTFSSFLSFSLFPSFPSFISFFLSSFFSFFLFCGTGVWIQGSLLTKQVLYHLSHFSSPFCSGYFGDGVLPSICLPIGRIIGVSHEHLAIFLSS
jgi:hypothetical protein